MKNYHRTKIVCTIGPAVMGLEKLKELVLSGMNVARLNFSHGDHDTHGESIKLLKQVREELGVPLAIMLDTKGPEIRVGKIKNGSMELKDGDKITFVKEIKEGDEQGITLTPPSVIDALVPGMTVLLDNGYILTKVVEVKGSQAVVEVEHGGKLSSNKGINIPGANIELPNLTEKDISDITFGCQQDVDIIAASFIRSASDVLAVRELLSKNSKKETLIISKIENRQGIDLFDEILTVSDGIMIARGDLGMEMPLTQVPKLQKMIMRKCHIEGKITVVATQMLESMIVNPLPTRAEVSDVANAIYDGASAVMLSAETATGKYPIQAVSLMKEIAEITHDDFDYQSFFEHITSKVGYDEISVSTAASAVWEIYKTKAKAIFVLTTFGNSALSVSRFRPPVPVFAITQNKKVYNQLSVAWGVIPVLLTSEITGMSEVGKCVAKYALEQGSMQEGDLVVSVASVPFGKMGSTNSIMTTKIGQFCD